MQKNILNVSEAKYHYTNNEIIMIIVLKFVEKSQNLVDFYCDDLITSEARSARQYVGS